MNNTIVDFSKYYTTTKYAKYLSELFGTHISPQRINNWRRRGIIKAEYFGESIPYFDINQPLDQLPPNFR